ncbi:hypothetical protein Ciccas_006323 [Cichlidogyrus casuarinus]|uniref:Uncharacterized protein n=1 Tax=Cichlidogyrus casuarinus TaxID=1844966 RepID=A0ABD2Q8H1_9PLAT
MSNTISMRVLAMLSNYHGQARSRRASATWADEVEMREMLEREVVNRDEISQRHRPKERMKAFFLRGERRHSLEGGSTFMPSIASKKQRTSHKKLKKRSFSTGIKVKRDSLKVPDAMNESQSMEDLMVVGKSSPMQQMLLNAYSREKAETARKKSNVCRCL